MTTKISQKTVNNAALVYGLTIGYAQVIADNCKDVNHFLETLRWDRDLFACWPNTPKKHTPK